MSSQPRLISTNPLSVCSFRNTQVAGANLGIRGCSGSVFTGLGYFKAQWRESKPLPRHRPRYGLIVNFGEHGCARVQRFGAGGVNRMARRNLVEALQAELADTERRADALRAALEALGEISSPRAARSYRRKGPRRGGEAGKRRQRGRRRFTAAQRKAQSDKMRAYWSKRKAAKK